MQPIILLSFAVLCVGCGAHVQTASDVLAHPAQIRGGGAYFEGGTVSLKFVGHDGTTKVVYLPHGKPNFDSVVGWLVGRPFFVGGNGDTNGHQVEVGSSEEGSIIASLKRVDPKSDVWATAQEFLAAAKIERYVAAHPKLSNRRRELATAFRNATIASATQPSPWETDDLTERENRKVAEAKAEAEEAYAAGRWEEFCDILEMLVEEDRK